MHVISPSHIAFQLVETLHHSPRVFPTITSRIKNAGWLALEKVRKPLT